MKNKLVVGLGLIFSLGCASAFAGNISDTVTVKKNDNWGYLSLTDAKYNVSYVLACDLSTDEGKSISVNVSKYYGTFGRAELTTSSGQTFAQNGALAVAVNASSAKIVIHNVMDQSSYFAKGDYISFQNTGNSDDYGTITVQNCTLTPEMAVEVDTSSPKALPAFKHHDHAAAQPVAPTAEPTSTSGNGDNTPA